MHTHWSRRQSISQLRGFLPRPLKSPWIHPQEQSVEHFRSCRSSLTHPGSFLPEPADRGRPRCASPPPTGRKMANRGCGVLLGWACGALKIESVAQNRRGKELLARRTLLHDRGRFISNRPKTWILFFPPKGNRWFWSRSHENKSDMNGVSLLVGASPPHRLNHLNESRLKC